MLRKGLKQHRMDGNRVTTSDCHYYCGAQMMRKWQINPSPAEKASSSPSIIVNHYPRPSTTYPDF